MRKYLFYTLVISLLIIVVQGVTAINGVPAYNYTDTGALGSGFSSTAYSPGQVAMAFTANVTATVYNVSAAFGCRGCGTPAKMTVYNATAGGTPVPDQPLATYATVTGARAYATCGSTSCATNWTSTTGWNMTSGTTYALVFDGGHTSSSDDFIMTSSNPGTPGLPNGELLYNASSGAASCTTTGSGKWCTDGNNMDTSFWLYTAAPAASAVYNVTFNSQTPSDINSVNIMNATLNITYNFTIVGFNTSSARLNYSINNSGVYINGTFFGGILQVSASGNSTNQTYYFQLDDEDVYPASYNLAESTMEAVAHSAQALTSSNSYLSTEIYNVSNSSQFSFLELMANTTSPTVTGQVWYCNSTYDFVSGSNVATSPYCVQFGSFNTQTYNHTKGTSSHIYVPFTMNVTTGKFGTVSITPTSYFLVRGDNTGTVNAYTIATTSRINATRTSINNGNTWSAQTYTLDAHLHQFNGSNIFIYAACGSNTSGGGYECSAYRSDLLDVLPLPPTSPQVTSPTSAQNVTHYLNITWNAAQPFGAGVNITKYNISLMNSDSSFNTTINGSVGTNLSFLWDTYTNFNLTPGQYIIRVTATDTNNNNATGFSPLFNITANAYVNFTATGYFTGFNITSFTVNVSNSTTGFSTQGTYNASLGGAIVDIVKGGYNLVIDAENYTLDYENATFPADNNSYNFVLKTNNSIIVNIYDESTGLPLTANVSVEVSGTLYDQTFFTTTASVYVQNLTDGAYTVKLTASNYSLKTYTVTVATRSTQILNAYLSTSISTTIFTVVDSVTSQSIEGAAVGMYRLVNGSLQLVQSSLTDVTGRTQLVYSALTKYSFTISATNYTSKTFTLDPILFSAYDIALTPIVTQTEQYGDTNVYFQPSTFYKDGQTNFTILFNSANGYLSVYNVSITFPGGNYNNSGVNANGGSFATSFNLSGAALTDVVVVEYAFKDVFGATQYFKQSYGIIGTYGNQTIVKLKDNTYGMGVGDRILVATVITIIVAGVATMAAGSLIGVFIGLFIYGFLAFAGFIPWVLIFISAIIGFFIVVRRSGESYG